MEYGDSIIKTDDKVCLRVNDRFNKVVNEGFVCKRGLHAGRGGIDNLSVNFFIGVYIAGYHAAHNVHLRENDFCNHVPILVARFINQSSMGTDTTVRI